MEAQEGGMTNWGQEGTFEAYYFVADAGAGARQKLLDLMGLGVIRTFVPLMSGAYGYLAFFQVDVEEFGGLDGAFAEIKARMDSVRNIVNPPAGSAAIPLWGPLWPSHWSEKPPYGAFVRITVEAGMAESVMTAIEALDLEYWAAVVVAGDFDILLEIDSETLDDLSDKVLNQIQTISGITRTETAFALNAAEEGAPPP
jgi:DNA-binding Lrp family transcriptional regulator